MSMEANKIWNLVQEPDYVDIPVNEIPEIHIPDNLIEQGSMSSYGERGHFGAASEKCSSAGGRSHTDVLAEFAAGGPSPLPRNRLARPPAEILEGVRELDDGAALAAASYQSLPLVEVEAQVASVDSFPPLDITGIGCQGTAAAADPPFGSEGSTQASSSSQVGGASAQSSPLREEG
eukprot:CAMPEP_0115188214 /NCGR_PEP_ID=MMETSP0270-20121206/10894_1 /TAXON_ID=71861 /ORGANISM="Scrippsiella trochoidea, Strain CCMP3099" /LENGTH=176 /DNA_ID=CAMNT_0002601387 /DNA_START=34 /DNA_END=561 /DNA_ORIENTATION=+